MDGEARLGRRSSFAAFLLALVAGIASAAPLIADAGFDRSGSILLGRQLLQTKSGCKVDFKGLNYTTIKSRCRESDGYPREPCCDAFLQLACPFVDEFNDLNTTCSESFYSYLKLNGNYPQGLFAHLCPGDRKGIPCPENYTRSAPPPSPAEAARQSSAISIAVFTVFFILACMFL